MELSERCIAQLEKEGWEYIYEWQDKPGTVYVEHSHKGAVVLMVTEGSIELTVGGGEDVAGAGGVGNVLSSVADGAADSLEALERTTTLLRAGDRFDIPPHTPHFALVGPQGVQFVVGEEIEGDS